MRRLVADIVAVAFCFGMALAFFYYKDNVVVLSIAALVGLGGGMVVPSLIDRRVVSAVTSTPEQKKAIALPRNRISDPPSFPPNLEHLANALRNPKPLSEKPNPLPPPHGLSSTEMAQALAPCIA